MWNRFLLRPLPPLLLLYEDRVDAGKKKNSKTGRDGFRHQGTPFQADRRDLPSRFRVGLVDTRSHLHVWPECDKKRIQKIETTRSVVKEGEIAQTSSLISNGRKPRRSSHHWNDERRNRDCLRFRFRRYFCRRHNDRNCNGNNFLDPFLISFQTALITTPSSFRSYVFGVAAETVRVSSWGDSSFRAPVGLVHGSLRNHYRCLPSEQRESRPRL
mmetsp:Transcript_14407/g.33509  ORF Transcript_14407/g.33509 Transcript_14407/m.33509 type:complete len:214 (+) Transcript_14407:3549-4190(+)